MELIKNMSTVGIIMGVIGLLIIAEIISCLVWLKLRNNNHNAKEEENISSNLKYGIISFVMILVAIIVLFVNFK